MGNCELYHQKQNEKIVMYALVDCNNFFVSAERVFRPDLQNCPVCVLSNNDGCIVALSNEAKAIGLHRGDPYFKVKDIVAKYHVKIFSSNYSLYAGISSRVMQVLAQACPDMEIYSIDEAFLLFDDRMIKDMDGHLRRLRAQILKWIGIPTSIGYAPTKTLAKVAAYYAKHYQGYHGVCMIDSEEKRVKALKRLPLKEVWGIGRKNLQKLNEMGVGTAWHFTQLNEESINHWFHLPGVRTRNELLGIPCIENGESETKQSICNSSSFGELITEKSQLFSSIVHFTTKCAQKLRRQHTVANILSIFIATDRFKTDSPQYKQYATTKLLVPSADTTELIEYAKKMLDKIYLPNYQYKKAGVVVSGIVENTNIQQNIFDEMDNRDKRQQLFHTIDKINAQNGAQTVHFAIQDAHNKWTAKKEFRSPNYLSDVNELLEVK